MNPDDERRQKIVERGGNQRFLIAFDDHLPFIWNIDYLKFRVPDESDRIFIDVLYREFREN